MLRATTGNPAATAFLACILLAAGCVSGTQAPLLRAQQPQPGAAEVQGGSLVVSVRWPTYAAQLLPSSTVLVVVTVKTLAGAGLGSATLYRSAGAATSTAQFNVLPAGTVTVSAEAKDSNGLVVADGSVAVVIISNKRSAAVLTLSPTFAPKITGFSPKAGAAGSWIYVTGASFKVDSPMRVALGGIVLSPSDAFAESTTRFIFKVPAGATTSAISVTVDGVTGKSANAFTTVSRLALSPVAIEPVASGSTTTFTVTAYDTASPPAAVPGAEVDWRLPSDRQSGVSPLPTPGPTPTPTPTPTPSPTPTPTPTPTPDPGATPTPTPTPIIGATGGPIFGGGGPIIPPLGAFNPTTGITNAQGQASAAFTAQATGSAWVEVWCGTKVASASIAVDR